MRRPPGFWWREAPSPAARLLSPLAAIYGTLAARRMARRGAAAPCPVICIGNVTLGGAGKTPTALAVADHLRDLGRRPAFLSRGYGGRLAGPVRVDPARHAARDVGDEPLLLARAAPAIVARDRIAGAIACLEAGADVVVMDDGLQNPSLVKDLALAVFDGAVGLGNGLVVPAGPLRAPAAMQWGRIDAVLVIGGGAPGARVLAQARARGLPALRGRLAPDPVSAAALRGQPVLAFAGIGRPEKFFATLRDLGADLRETRAFPDHHAFTPAEAEALTAEAARRKLLLVTTEKDRVRLPEGMPVATLPVVLDLDEPDVLLALLRGL
ncbi:tetraacyldisaccharide 4'-kinase [Methylobacterium nonmethylotrophicum]|uniref:Tetraacyldisaccharide 4'-kinase n=1 Tax=Methylobacterium nonmethylotrophicum TaxID=1141884 RepID=A0A4Z0NQ81_9HYPH|nr:tetraacyldisaccharide 4'-kinase [Methylobacterium nonmethylotrophicum]TGD98582.1 tetraacyldisaccharide 4'-kinase [Methylobacterium nonmethylotrophicum]